MITAFGKTYETVADAQARWTEIEKVNQQYGPSDDRVTEQNALREGIAIWAAAEQEGLTEAQVDVWTVEKQDYEVPCEHPACATMHRHLHNARFEHPHYEYVQNLRTGEEKQVWVSTYHMATRTEWVVLLNGTREGKAGEFDTYSTKREAVAALQRAGLL